MEYIHSMATTQCFTRHGQADKSGPANEKNSHRVIIGDRQWCLGVEDLYSCRGCVALLDPSRKENQRLAECGALLAEKRLMRMLVLTLLALSADALAGGSGSASLQIGVTVNQSICTPQQQAAHPRACARTAQTTTVETARFAKPNAPGSAYPYTISVDPQQNVIVKTIYT